MVTLVIKKQETKMAEELASKEEANIMFEKKFSSGQEEIEDKKKKLQKLYNKYQSSKAEIMDMQDEFTREREAYQDQLRELARQLKLKSMMIDNFVPQDEVDKVEIRAQWSEEIDDWVLPNLELSANLLRGKRPGSALGLKRPTSEYARLARNLGDTNPRFKPDNIMQLDLDMPPEKFLDEFDGSISQKVQNTINIALNEDEDEIAMMNLESQPNVYLLTREENGVDKDDGQGNKDRKPARLKSAVPKKPMSAVKKDTQSTTASSISSMSSKSESVKKEPPAEENFPKARGLVKRPTKI